jgi:excisionase family DNA binding protein
MLQQGPLLVDWHALCWVNAGKRSPIKSYYRKEKKTLEEIMTPSEVAALLKIHLKTVYKLAEKGAIPGNRIGRSWRFSRSDVLELVSSKPINSDFSQDSSDERQSDRK